MNLENQTPRHWAWRTGGVALAAFVIGAGMTSWFGGGPDSTAAAVNVPLKPQQGVLDLQESFINVAREVGKAVVHVTTRIKIRGQIMDPWDPFDDFFGDFFGERRSRRRPQMREYEQELEGGIGTGMIVREDGYVLTNRHVIEPVLQADNGEISVIIQGEDGKKKTYKGELKGYRRNPDLAIIKINAKGLPTVKFGDSDKVRVGEWAIAVGNPFAYDNTVTVGIVSAKYRELKTDSGSKLRNLIQTDAAINPGNSGGPLSNVYGEIVGVNVAIASGGAAQSAGIGFAIPANDVKDVLEDLMRGKAAQDQHPWMGVSLREADEEQDGVAEGVVIEEVIADSPADEAGLRSQDIILTMNAKKVRTAEDLIADIQQKKIGEKVVLTLLRKKKEITKEVTLMAAPGAPERPSRRRSFQLPWR